MRYYVLVVKILSNGNEDRSLTAYDDYDTALRKYHESFNTIGGGPRQIATCLLGEGLITLKREVWTASTEVEAVEE